MDKQSKDSAGTLKSEGLVSLNSLLNFTNQYIRRGITNIISTTEPSDKHVDKLKNFFVTLKEEGKDNPSDFDIEAFKSLLEFARSVGYLDDVKATLKNNNLTVDERMAIITNLML